MTTFAIPYGFLFASKCGYRTLWIYHRGLRAKWPMSERIPAWRQ